MKLRPDETVLTGNWIVQNRQVSADATCERIEELISSQLQKVADDPQSGGWETLYKDPDDGRYWERTYPQGEMHGGGPPELRYLATEQAKKKYGV
jgi:hypothetical protein